MLDPTPEQLQAWLTLALDARHKLLTGAAVASVRYGDREVTYTKSDFDKLDAYIASLRSQLSTPDGDPAARVRPIHFSF